MKALLLLALCVSAPAASAANARLSVLKPPSAARIDGQDTYFYEIVVENTGSSDLRVTGLASDGGALGKQSYSEAQLRDRFRLLLSFDLDPLPDWQSLPNQGPAPPAGVIPPGRSGIYYLQLLAAPGTPAPAAIHHALKLSTGEELAYDVPVAAEPVLVLASPFRGGLWFPFNPPEESSPHRRSVLRFHGGYYLAQRFAIDWMEIGDGGTLVKAGQSSKENASYFGYGTPVYAVADAVVEKITDDIPENIPDDGTRAVTINIRTVAGNSVILRLGKDRYALYAHLQPGSLRVKAGDAVQRGQQIGLLGNSGNSTAPHLHFHVCDGPSALECQGVPYVFESFRHQAVSAENGEDIGKVRFTPVGESEPAVQELTRTNRQISF